ncbi:prolyl oligopeptidase family serine peptidase [Pendulispora albinea]|uniref:S9 family peptidase n=1 Tax=Pendulispora albinea TaxID=2741071 RepID=A0ABZ2LY77_9BACT
MFSQLLALPTAWSPRFSTCGGFLYFIGPGPLGAALYRTRLDGGGDGATPEPLVADSRVVSFIVAPGAAPRLVYAVDAEGDENTVLWCLDVDSGARRCLTASSPRTVSVLERGCWHPERLAFSFESNRRSADLFDVFVGDLEGNARCVFENDEPGYILKTLFAHAGQTLFVLRACFSGVAGTRKDQLLSVDLTSGAIADVTPPGGGCFFSLRWRSAHDTLLVLTDQGDDYVYLAEVDPRSRSLRTLAKEPFDISMVEVSPAGSECVFVVDAAGRSILKRLDLSSDERVPERLLDAVGVIDGAESELAFSANGHRLAFAYESARRPRGPCVVELHTGEVKRVGDPFAASPDLGSRLIEPTLISIRSFDGLAMSGWFYEPRGSERFPVVVHVHGGPEAQSVPSFDPRIQAWLDAGYGVLAPNVRGSTGFGKHFEHLDDGELRMDAVRDVGEFARRLKDHPRVDPTRLVVHGASYGGFVVLSTMIQEPHLWAAGVCISGISNFLTFLERTAGYRRASREAKYGSLQRDRDFLRSISPIEAIHRISRPLMLVHGRNDPRVPVGETVQVAERLRAAGVEPELMLVEGEGHRIVRPENRIMIARRISQFLTKALARPQA